MESLFCQQTLISPRMEAGYSTFTVGLRVIESYEKGTRYLEVQLNQSVTGRLKYRRRFPQFRGWI
jgi:hypothetical protein